MQDGYLSLWYKAFFLKNCKIYLTGTKKDLIQEDKNQRAVDYHVTTDYADGEWGWDRGDT